MSQSAEQQFARCLYELLEILKISGGVKTPVPQTSKAGEQIALLESLVGEAGLLKSYKEYLRSLLVEAASPSGFVFRQETVEDCCQAVLKAADSFWREKRLAEKFGLRVENSKAI